MVGGNKKQQQDDNNSVELEAYLKPSWVLALTNIFVILAMATTSILLAFLVICPQEVVAILSKHKVKPMEFPSGCSYSSCEPPHPTGQISTHMWCHASGGRHRNLGMCQHLWGLLDKIKGCKKTLFEWNLFFLSFLLHEKVHNHWTTPKRKVFDREKNPKAIKTELVMNVMKCFWWNIWMKEYVTVLNLDIFKHN
jgi:hypothetical protein